MPDKELANGHVVGDGRFAVTGKLGAGSQGITYEAVDKQHGTLVALKQFSVRGAQTWKDVELAEREAAVLSSLENEHLPRYLAHFEEDGCLYLAMERILGRPVSELREPGKLQQRDVVQFLFDSAATLTYLHGHAPPIIHRDIKPGNVIRRPSGHFALVDFGSVRARLETNGGSTVVGTFGYMAPEQFQGRAMPASDVYATAATALSMLVGKDPDQLPHKGLAIDVTAALGHEVDPRLRALLSEALNPDPDERSKYTLQQLLQRHGVTLESTAVDSGSSVPGAVNTPRSSAAPQPATSASAPRSADHTEARQRSGAGAVTPQAISSFDDPAARVWLRSFGWLVLWGLWVARVAVATVLGFAVPLLLTVLSVFVGRGPRKAAQQCRLASRQARRALQHASTRVVATMHDNPRPSHRGPRRKRHRGPRVQVAPPAEGPERASKSWEDELQDAAREVEHELRREFGEHFKSRR